MIIQTNLKRISAGNPESKENQKKKSIIYQRVWKKKCQTNEHHSKEHKPET